MEQLYLIEIFIDKVTIFVSDTEEPSTASKNLIVKVRFGPNKQFIIKEGQLAVSEKKKEDIVEADELGRRRCTRTIRVGKSYLFPSYPDTILMILSKFPLEIEVWNDDENEVEIFVGIGTMHWNTEFYLMLKESAEACKLHDPLSIKQVTPISAECCCKQVGEVAFILRISALGETISTEFQQLMEDPETFVFRTDRAPSMFQCKRIEGDNPNFCMIGSLYETATLEDPSVLEAALNKIEVCTELQSCGGGQAGADYKCEHGTEQEPKDKKTYPIDEIRMGDITGPCGNANCPLARKVRCYIRNLEAYKKQAGGLTATKDDTTRKVCGTCGCKDDRWHRDSCPEMQENKETCPGCQGLAKAGDTCQDREQNYRGTGNTPRGSPTPSKVAFVTKLPGYAEALFGKDFIVENLIPNYDSQDYNNDNYQASTSHGSNVAGGRGGCCCRRSLQTFASNCPNTTKLAAPTLSLSGRNLQVYNTEFKESTKNIYNLTIQEETDCKCSPPKPSPPCKTFDCECISKTAKVAARKQHRSYCPSFKHKNTCPVIMTLDEEDKDKDKDDEEKEPLPYGLPSIKLGPCPILGRPCTYPDGFAKMYRVAAQPALPDSYTDAGKVCCSREYEKIKKAIEVYLKYEKDHDFRCFNKFEADTEKRCCDKEQWLMSVMGKGCCGAHKMDKKKLTDKQT